MVGFSVSAINKNDVIIVAVVIEVSLIWRKTASDMGGEAEHCRGDGG